MPPSYCQLCGQPLSGRVHIFRHPAWEPGRSLSICTACYHSSPRCMLCGLPVAADQATGGRPDALCLTCCGVQHPKCMACGRVLTTTHTMIEGIGPFCLECFNSRQPCNICGAPLTDERWQLSDGRISCARCHSTAVDTPAEAGAIYTEVQQAVEALFGLKLNIPTGLALVDRNQLSQILIQMQPESEEPLDPASTLGVYVRKGMKRGIYVQSGLPESLLIRVAAHEHAHAWQGENCPLLRDLLLREGFAEWVAYHVLCYYRLDPQVQQMVKAAGRAGCGNIYCQGLRFVLELENRVGAAGVIAQCRNSGRIGGQGQASGQCAALQGKGKQWLLS